MSKVFYSTHTFSYLIKLLYPPSNFKRHRGHPGNAALCFINLSLSLWGFQDWSFNEAVRIMSSCRFAIKKCHKQNHYPVKTWYVNLYQTLSIRLLEESNNFSDQIITNCIKITYHCQINTKYIIANMDLMLGDQVSLFWLYCTAM